MQVYPRGELCIAEYWNDGGIGDPGFTTPEMLAEYADAADGHFGCFDFPLKKALHQAAQTNDWSHLGSSKGLPGLMGIRPHLAFTFIDNHDTSAPQVTWRPHAHAAIRQLFHITGTCPAGLV